MPLDDYRKKRDFRRSPEPTGDRRRVKATGRRKPRFFCVHKHLASHLHYDFRIEHNGVLLSWAVPKGPSLDPSIKRYARFVEDHPIEYGSFEGVIPEGYGAGIVMQWDRGTWTPETDDVDAALAKGDLKFSLDGFKLKGSWVLVRTRGYSRGGNKDDGKNWLLIKHRDFWSGDLDIAEFAPRSVKTEFDFPEILAEEDPDIWRSNRPVEGGETGAMLREIIRQAAELKAGRTAPAKPARRKPSASKKKSKSKDQSKSSKKSKSPSPRSRKTR